MSRAELIEVWESYISSNAEWEQLHALARDLALPKGTLVMRELIEYNNEMIQIIEELLQKMSDE